MKKFEFISKIFIVAHSLEYRQENDLKILGPYAQRVLDMV
jgi:hypothetical protein